VAVDECVPFNLLLVEQLRPLQYDLDAFSELHCHRVGFVFTTVDELREVMSCKLVRPAAIHGVEPDFSLVGDPVIRIFLPQEFRDSISSELDHPVPVTNPLGIAYEVKWDGFRAIVSTEEELRVRSRRGWDMTPHVGFLVELPVRAVLDGELVALDPDGKPDFPLICECLLQRHPWTSLTYMVFDVLSVDGEPLTMQPYAQRRIVLEDLQLDGRQWRTTQTFDDGESLWEAVCEHELEGVVAKLRRSRYVPSERGWVKTKNRDYWRWELEREGAFDARRERQFV
jgi:hypothetical protein